MKRCGLFILSAVLAIVFSCQTQEGKDQYCKSSDGVKICYTEYGQGEELIVLIHGWSCDKSYWSKQVDYFKQEYHVVTIDLGGHGKSGLNRDNWTMSAYGDDINSVLKKMDFQKAYLAGHSMGSDVILEAANKWGENNIELFLVDRFNDTPMPWIGESFDNFLQPFKDDFVTASSQWIKQVMFVPESDPELIEWIAKDMSQADPKVALSAMENLFSNDYTPIINQLKQRHIPMTLINSDYQPLKIDNLQKVGFEVVTMSDCGHFVMMEQPETFNNILKGMIEKYDESDLIVE
ncbi:alpha/beta fold hydrolase [Carboxylicivirga sp. N1Y90]|uniref:alpha/beta fold hydrolase n=1 Tax=Carboxylicivirga fragile TaxID=3417571 RepID=UPI003D33D1E3|nr:alpha/beta hydrolase [Marinilabiliaceae bacterium N1Y90]